MRDNPDEIEELLYQDHGDSEPSNYLDLDKAWHGLHYLFTGEVYGGPRPLSLAIVGGTDIGPDVGYGPARYLTAEEVATVAEALAALTPDALAQRFDPQDMETKQIYPGSWVSEGNEAFEYLLYPFAQLQKFYADAASRGDAILQWHS